MQTELQLPAGIDPEYEPFNRREDLLDYLTDPAARLVRLVEMPRIIDGSFFTPFFHAVYSHEVQVPIFSQEVLDEITAMRDDDLSPEEIELKRNILMSRAPAERSSIIYADAQTESIQMIPPNHGTVASGQFPIYEFLNTDHKLIMSLHTHPDDVFFSAEDFNHLVFNPTGDHAVRLLKATTVLCPHLQLLAMITADTLTFIDEDNFKTNFSGSSLSYMEKREYAALILKREDLQLLEQNELNQQIEHFLWSHIQRNSIQYARDMNWHYTIPQI